MLTIADEAIAVEALATAGLGRSLADVTHRVGVGGHVGQVLQLVVPHAPGLGARVVLADHVASLQQRVLWLGVAPAFSATADPSLPALPWVT